MECLWWFVSHIFRVLHKFEILIFYDFFCVFVITTPKIAFPHSLFHIFCWISFIFSGIVPQVTLQIKFEFEVDQISLTYFMVKSRSNLEIAFMTLLLYCDSSKALAPIENQFDLFFCHSDSNKLWFGVYELTWRLLMLGTGVFMQSSDCSCYAYFEYRRSFFFLILFFSDARKFFKQQ